MQGRRVDMVVVCYPPSADNTNLDLDNSGYHAQPHRIIVNYLIFYHHFLLLKIQTALSTAPLLSTVTQSYFIELNAK